MMRNRSRARESSELLGVVLHLKPYRCGFTSCEEILPKKNSVTSLHFLQWVSEKKPVRQPPSSICTEQSEQCPERRNYCRKMVKP